jgi:1,4-dihydroxy-2-naphthoate octaprenyltransferase
MKGAGDIAVGLTKGILAFIGRFFSIITHQIKMRRVYKDSHKSD